MHYPLLNEIDIKIRKTMPAWPDREKKLYKCRRCHEEFKREDLKELTWQKGKDRVCSPCFDHMEANKIK